MNATDKSVLQTHELVDSIARELLLTIGMKLGLTKECVEEMVDPDSNEPWSHGSFLKYAILHAA